MKSASKREAGIWIRRAKSNLAIAKAGKPTGDVLYEDLCFDAQQAAEKALKALSVFYFRKMMKNMRVFVTYAGE
jgi:HEPN domain-containing protein